MCVKQSAFVQMYGSHYQIRNHREPSARVMVRGPSVFVFAEAGQ